MDDSRGLIGRSLGQYRIEECLGEGGFATVYRGYQPKLERVVAVKVLHEHLARNKSLVTRFKREAEAAFSLQHPNIVRAYDLGQSDGLWFIVMQYVDGPSLRDVLLRQGGFNVNDDREDLTRVHDDDVIDATVLKDLTGYYQPLELGLVAQVTADICAALDYAHGMKVLHRDLKPDNILISKEGRALLGDFGIARLQEDDRLTRTGSRLGSVAYMSPEQIRGKRNLDQRSDIYSLGVMLFEMLTGTVPFVGTETVVWSKHLEEPPPCPTALRDDVPPEVEAIVLRCLEKAPEDRFASAGAMAQALLKVTRPIPLTTLFTAISDTAEMVGVETNEEAAILSCPHCGNSLRLRGDAGFCPACQQPTTLVAGQAEHARLIQVAETFIVGFNLNPDLSLEVLAYEYERTIEPVLRERYAAALKTWQDLLAYGSVIPPFADVNARPSADRVLAAAKELWNLAQLLEAEPVGKYIVAISSRRQRRERVAELRARAHQLIALYHSLHGAAGSTPQEMREAYEAARTSCLTASEALQDHESVALPGIQLSSRLTEAILQYPQDSAVASQLLADWPPPLTAAGRPLPGQELDLAALRSYNGAADQAEERVTRARYDARRALDEANDLLNQRDEHLRALELERTAEAGKAVAVEREINEARTRELDRFLRQGIWVRLGVVVGPLILTLLLALLLRAVKGHSNLSVPFFIALGTLTLPLAAAYLAGILLPTRADNLTTASSPGPAMIGAANTPLDKYDLGPIAIVILGVWSFLLTALWYTGVGGADVDIGIQGSTVRGAIIWFVLLAAGWTAWVALGLPQIRVGGDVKGSVLPFATGAVVALTTFIFLLIYVVAVWKWTGWMHWILILMAGGLAYLGWRSASFVKRMSTAEGAAEVHRKRELKKLQAETQQTLDRLTAARRDAIVTCNTAVQPLLSQANERLAMMRSEADRLSARLLRTKVSTELFDFSDIEAELGKTNERMHVLQTW